MKQRTPLAAIAAASDMTARRREAAELYDRIRPGSRVRILTPQGQVRQGRAVMEGPAGWVLNLGGRHGTPGIATERNLVAVL